MIVTKYRDSDISRLSDVSDGLALLMTVPLFLLELIMYMKTRHPDFPTIEVAWQV